MGARPVGLLEIAVIRVHAVLPAFADHGPSAPAYRASAIPRRAVSKALCALGLFNYDRTTEPPPAITKQLDDAIQGFQRSNGLSVDGEVNPSGCARLPRPGGAVGVRGRAR